MKNIKIPTHEPQLKIDPVTSVLWSSGTCERHEISRGKLYGYRKLGLIFPVLQLKNGKVFWSPLIIKLIERIDKLKKAKLPLHTIRKILYGSEIEKYYGKKIKW